MVEELPLCKCGCGKRVTKKENSIFSGYEYPEPLKDRVIKEGEKPK